ncbi:MAG TPA: hypothetical protein VI844_03350 [Coxiellaceae bacterium]|nr:hypothetical protein [Coxiellaceae bacterium]
MKKMTLFVIGMTLSWPVFANCASDEDSMRAVIARYDSLTTKNDVPLYRVMDPLADPTDPSSCSGIGYRMDAGYKKYYLTWRAGDWGNTLVAIQ